MQWVKPPDDNAESSDEPYRSYGRFEPFDAKRILERFAAKQIRFQISDASGLIPIGQIMYEPPTRMTRLNAIEIFVHRDDEDKARKIISEN
jgi:hypothetical protein